jgi:death-on-curing protein
MFSDNSEQDLEFLTYIHDQIIDASGGVKGFHNKGLIESALARPLQSVIGKDAYSNPYTKAAALLDSIANNHGFRDGNKRTAMAAASFFLDNSDINLDITNQEYEDFMLHVVNNKPEVNEISSWLRKHSEPIAPTNWHLVDGKKRNQEHPDTFEIPSQKEIHALTVGSFIKLGFEVDETKESATSERMWVEITAIDNNEFTGRLRNDPATIRGLKYDDAISFKDLHILTVDDL